MTFIDLIDRWGTVARFATAVGVPERTAMSWRQRNSIPAKWFSHILKATPPSPVLQVTAAELIEAAENTKTSEARSAVCS